MGLLTARPSSTHFVVDHPLFLDVKENPEWKSQFGNSHPLKLEIGFGMGDFLIAMARKEPESNFVGIVSSGTVSMNTKRSNQIMELLQPKKACW